MGLMPMFPENSLTFWLISSGICLFIGVLFTIGSWQQWSALGSENGWRGAQLAGQAAPGLTFAIPALGILVPKGVGLCAPFL